jgi:membrane protease YdiL (CAAX protease family)
MNDSLQAKPTSTSNKATAAAVLFAMTFPTIVTLVYFQWLRQSESSLQQIAFGTGKILQFGFPVVFVYLFHREKLQRTWHRIRYSSSVPTDVKARSRICVLMGSAFGMAVGLAMFILYFTVIDGTEVATNLSAMVAQKITSFGLDAPWKYFALLIFYAFGHSFLEEYYWRWFVFDFLRRFFPAWTANFLSSLGFMAHHVVVLGFFFGWSSPWTYVTSLGVAIGGSFWAWLYQREGRLLSAWISHMIVDAWIFTLGYLLLRGTVY